MSILYATCVMLTFRIIVEMSELCLMLSYQKTFHGPTLPAERKVVINQNDKRMIGVCQGNLAARWKNRVATAVTRTVLKQDAGINAGAATELQVHA